MALEFALLTYLCYFVALDIYILEKYLFIYRKPIGSCGVECVIIWTTR